MIATFGNTKLYEYQQVAGFLIRGGLLPKKGLETRLSVLVLLGSRIDNELQPLPCWDERLDAATVWKDSLTIASGEVNPELNYVFPDIQFEAINSYYTNAYQYHLLHFGYREDITKTPPAITVVNKCAPTIASDRIRCKGTLATNAAGSNEAPLLGLQAYQEKDRACGLQITTERCRHNKAKDETGWFHQILQQSSVQCKGGKEVDLKFQLNGQEYDCSSGGQGLNFMLYEERYGLALNLPLPSLMRLCKMKNDDLPPSQPYAVEDLFGGALPAAQIMSDLEAGDKQLAYADKVVEVCSVASGTKLMRQFDWRTARQKPAAAAQTGDGKKQEAGGKPR